VRVEEVVVRTERGRGGEAARKEGARLLAATGERDFVVALEAEGKAMSSEELARWLARRLDSDPRPLCFLVGGASGLSADVTARADLLLSLSRMTFPHQIARLLLLEQLYRAFSISAGLRYH
jgi:23S rRNA (pseudouridine1915-N3)-methyltransferase